LLKLDSLERFLTVKLFFFALPSVIFLALFEWQLDLKWQWIVISEFFLLLILFWKIAVLKFQIMRSFTRAALHLDAIKQEDYNQFAKSSYKKGKVKDFHKQLNELSEHLQNQKSRYDQHIFLVYQLIGQLDSPILIFNKKQQLSFGNDGFFHLFKQSWQMFRHASPELLGLQCTDGLWSFTTSNLNNKWQIRHSEFIEEGETQQLLVFINIESALRENQLNAWQQIIRVLGHEIRNSLTPVSSMAETLADKSLIERDKMVLNVITERCQHLQQFVGRYSTLSQNISLSCQFVSVQALSESVAKLFTDVEIIIENKVDEIWADLTFIEQVFINLIKNAKEANASNIQINFNELEQHYIIEVVDNGHGFANLDNLFVPLYSTKSDGQGIGLNFCRNVIEQHQGVLELDNNADNGVTVMIILPIPNFDTN